MSKLMYAALAALVLFGAALMISATPETAGGAPKLAQEGMDIRSLERTIDLKSLPRSELDPAVFQ
jgi:hypothetical protein